MAKRKQDGGNPLEFGTTPLFLSFNRVLRRLSLALVLAIAAIARIASIFVFRSYLHPQTWEFGNIATGINQGLGFTYKITDPPYDGIRVPSASMPPAYPYILAGFLRVFGDKPAAYLALELVNAALGVLLVYLVFRLAYLVIKSREAGLLASLICAIYPAQIFMCNEFHSISFYIVLSIAVIFFLCRYLAGSSPWKSILWAGICMGLLLLFRSEALALLPIYALCLILRKGMIAMAPAAIFVVISLLFLAPWVIRNERVFGEFLPTTTTTGLNLWIGNNPSATGGQHYDVVNSFPPQLKRQLDSVTPSTKTEIQDNAILKANAVAFIKSHPRSEIKLAFRKLFLFFAFDPSHDKGSSPLYWAPSIFLSLLAACGLWIRRRSLLRADLLLIVSITFAILVALVVFVLPRYKIVIDPLLMVFAGAIALKTSSAIPEAFRQKGERA